jgi:hypothetical protein
MLHKSIYKIFKKYALKNKKIDIKLAFTLTRLIYFTFDDHYPKWSLKYSNL